MPMLSTAPLFSLSSLVGKILAPVMLFDLDSVSQDTLLCTADTMLLLL